MNPDKLQQRNTLERARQPTVWARTYKVGNAFGNPQDQRLKLLNLSKPTGISKRLKGEKRILREINRGNLINAMADFMGLYGYIYLPAIDAMGAEDQTRRPRWSFVSNAWDGRIAQK